MLVNGIPGNTISIRDRGLLYGDGVFRTMRATSGSVPLWSLHFDKLEHDCERLGITCPSLYILCDELKQILTQQPNGVVKLIVTRGDGERGYTPYGRARPTRIWDAAPLPNWPAEWHTQGISLTVACLRLSSQPLLAGIKHLNRIENVLAAAELSDAQAHRPELAEILLLDETGNVIEGSRSNLFLVTGGKLVTPDLSRCGVAGVQRERVIGHAEGSGIVVEVRDVVLDELHLADEVFLTNSVFGVWSVREFEGKCWSNFKLASLLRAVLEGDSA